MFNFAQNYLTRGFWGDEAWTSLISQLPFLQMLKTTASDFHPPAYYAVIELVYKIFPPTEIATRMVSFLFYLLTIFMAYKLASNVRGHIFGMFSAAVLALNPIFFTYAFEARNYSMFAFCATGSIYFLTKLSQEFKRKDAIFFVLFTGLGIYTHYYMFFVLGAQGLYLIMFSSKGRGAFGWDSKLLKKMIGLYAVVGVLYLGWFPFLLGQLTSVSSSYWISPIDWERTHYEALLRIIGGEQSNTFRPFLFWLSSAMLVLGLIQHLRQKSFEKPYLLIWLWAIVPFVLATLPGLNIFGFQMPFRPIFFWRYLIPAAVPLSLVIVHAAQKLPKPFTGVFMVLILALSFSINVLTLKRYPETFKQAYNQKVLPKIGEDDKIVTVLPSFAEVLYYKNRNGLQNEMIVLNEGLVQFSGKSLLDAYAQNGTVRIGKASGRYFELLPGPSVQYKIAR